MSPSSRRGGRIGRLFRPDSQAAGARQLYAAAVAQARHPFFFTAAEVPDTLDGRFEMVALHTYLLLRRLKDGGADASMLAQAVFDAMFDDMDASLRELGAGDLGVGWRVKRMASGFYGRVAAYDAGLAAGQAVLAAALRRNLFGTTKPSDEAVQRMADYVVAVVGRLARQSLSALASGRVDFGPAGPAAGK